MSPTISDSVRVFVADAFYAPSDLGDDDSLLDTGTMDSTGVLELVVFLERRWSIAVGDREIHPDNFDSIGRIAAFVQRKLEALEGATCTSEATPAGGAPLSARLGDRP